MNKNTPFQSITPPLEYDKFSINNNTYKTYHIEQKTTKVNKTFNTKKKDIIYIDYNDKLLWSFYTIINNDFESFNTNHFKTEQDFKLKNVDLIEKNPDLLKPLKLQKHDIQHDLFHSKKINLDTLRALCVYNNISLIYVTGKKYYNLGNNEPEHIILDENNCVGVYINASAIKLLYYTNNYFLIENFKKPIKSLSGYSYDDLKNICIKINIQTTLANKKKTKKDLYEEILRII
tara:strand:- start:31828 stop:32526 length:699 start_codon:yes stop_codon:yes gene_type:complete